MTDQTNSVVVSYDPDQNLPASLWRPRNWRARPDPARPGKPVWLWGIVGLLAAYNPTVNLLLPDASHIVTNLGFAALVAVAAWKAGATPDNLGLRPDMVRRGLIVGAVAAAAVAAGILTSTALPQTREFLADDRFAGVEAGEALFEILLRIPLATATSEELLFRGVILGLLLRRWPVAAATGFAALLFGFWHVIPGLEALDTNPAGDLVDGPVAIGGSVAGTVVFTALAGVGFAWLRFRGNSLLTPILAHVATNSFGYLAGWLVVSGGWA